MIHKRVFDWWWHLPFSLSGPLEKINSTVASGGNLSSTRRQTRKHGLKYPHRLRNNRADKNRLEQRISKKSVIMHRRINDAFHCESFALYMLIWLTDPRFILSHLKFENKCKFCSIRKWIFNYSAVETLQSSLRVSTVTDCASTCSVDAFRSTL